MRTITSTKRRYVVLLYYYVFDRLMGQKSRFLVGDSRGLSWETGTLKSCWDAQTCIIIMKNVIFGLSQ
jgi:hypothetical protein